MSKHELIFSHQLHHRLARHAAFYIGCYILFLVFNYIPYGVFPAWNTERFSENVARLGLSRWLWLRFANSTLAFIPILLFAYTVIYFILPRFFFNKKKIMVNIMIGLGLITGIVLLQFVCGWLIAKNWAGAGPGRKVPSVQDIISRSSRDILLNYPLATGVAVLIKMLKRGWIKTMETHQVLQEKARAELQLLKSQIHPHFLFNTLNNIYFFTLTASQKAPEILAKLSDILRYILDECSRQLVTLDKELKLIEDYMALEKIRYGDRLDMHIEISGTTHNKMIPPLLLIPLVENSFKHGASKMLVKPWVKLLINIDDNFLFLVLSNSRPADLEYKQQVGHLGLNNVKKRLELLFPQGHEFNISETLKSYEVFMKVRLHNSHESMEETQISMNKYALA